MRFCRALSKGMSFLSGISFVLMLLVVFLQIFCRVLMPKTPAWTEEASRYLMIYLVAFSAGLAVENDAFVNVDTIFHFLKPKRKYLLKFINNCVLIMFFLIFFVASFKFYQLGIPQVSVTMPFVTMNLIFFSMLLLSAQIILYLTLKQRELLAYMKGTEGEPC